MGTNRRRRSLATLFTSAALPWVAVCWPSRDETTESISAWASLHRSLTYRRWRGYSCCERSSR